MNLLDSILNRITMYRLVLYYLLALIFAGVCLSAFGQLNFNPLSLIFSTIFILVVSGVTNLVFGKVFEVPTNFESVHISSLILALIIAPPRTLHDLPFLFWAGVLMVTSKFLFARKKKHIFNPVAISVLIYSIVLDQSANWWVGSRVLLPLVIVGGCLLVRKIKRFDLVYGFFLAAITTGVGMSLLNGTNVLKGLEKLVFDSPLLFFAFVMLTEPLTTPPTKSLQLIYGLITGLLFSPQLRLGAFYTTPESALLLGNIFSYSVSPKFKALLTLKEKIQLSPDQIDFVFSSDTKFKFTPGQYLEWTIDDAQIDSRGNRRYFTLASSPTEEDLHLGVKFFEPASAFKRRLRDLQVGEKVLAGAMSGDFLMPKDPTKKLVFIAGGIGITPFRSMVKYLLDKNEKRDIVLCYSDKTVDELVYREIFDHAYVVGLRPIYCLSDETKVPKDWRGKVGHITAETIKKEIPDFSERIFYISGSHGVVTSFQKVLHELGIPSSRIITDYFPGFV